MSAIEAAIQADPADSFVFDPEGAATLRSAVGTFPAGRFETPSIAALRQRALAARGGREGARVRLWVLDGASPATDIGSLQATAGPGTLFQATGGPQLNLLEAVCSPGVAQVRSGYLTTSDIANPSAFVAALESRFEEIRVGVHDDVPVVLGYNCDGAVAGNRRIGQVLTSTFAGGGYSSTAPSDAGRPDC